MYIASRIKMLLKFPSEKIKNIDKAIEKCEKEDGIEYADLQKKAITMALTEGMLVLTGGPGTGKTTTLNNKNNESKRQNCFAFCPHRQSGSTNERAHGR